MQKLSYGLNYQHAELLAYSNSTQQAQDWVLNNGDPFIENVGIGGVFFGTAYDSVEMVVGWTFDSRNRALFASLRRAPLAPKSTNVCVMVPGRARVRGM